MFRLLIFMALSLTAAAQCAPPNYNCPVHGTPPLPVIQQPATPNMGGLLGANRIVTPTDFNVPIIRCTDYNSTPGRSFFSQSFDVTDSGGGEDMIWNTNSTLLAVVETATGNGTVVSFNPATSQCVVPQPTLTINTGRSWSRSNPNLLRTLPSTSSIITDYTFNYLVPTTPPVVTNEFNFASCAGLGAITVAWNSAVTSSAGDAFLAAGFSNTGGQDTGVYVTLYQPSSGGCQIWNTSTGAITGSGGLPSGTATVNHAFLIHNVTMWPGGWIEVGIANGSCPTCGSLGPFFWQAGTLTTTLPTGSLGGHNAGGYADWFNMPGNGHLCGRPFATPVSCTFINTITGFHFPAAGSIHVSWSDANALETNPIFLSQSTYPNPAMFGGLNTTPLQGEIWGVFPGQGTNGTFIRVAHSFTSGYDNPVIGNFRTENAILGTSQDGRFIAFASDWMGTLGSNIGGSTCVPGGWPWQAAFAYANTYDILPSNNNAGGYSFQAQNAGTSNGLVEPTWPQSVNATVVDNGITWKNIGLPNCRNDVFIVSLAGLATAANTLFGFTETNTAGSNFPTVTYGMQRFWDSPPLQWPSLNTAPGVFNFANLDTVLAQSYAAGQREAFYTLGRTPSWITSQPLDTTCHYQLPAVGGGHGQCFAASDLNSDGSGTNATWKAWITAIASHANNATYLQTHAHIRYWEIWNEPDATFYWSGSYAQLARLTEDANCIITGRGVIHQSGNGVATSCTATPIDASAQIVMASGHADSAANLKYAQNQLYCNNSPSGIQLPCPNPANATATAIDIVNFHMKPGNATGNKCPAPTPCTLETALATYVVNLHGILQAAELAKPLWDGEAAYAEAGFTAPYNDPDMGASIPPRLYLSMMTDGITGSAWYTWDNVKMQAAKVQTSAQQAYNTLFGAVLTTPCAATGNVYSCTISRSGVQYLILWDNSKSCVAGICTTANQSVPAQWTTYQDMTAVPQPIAISGNIVPVGIKPVILQSGTVVSNPPAPATNVFVKVVKNDLSQALDGGTR